MVPTLSQHPLVSPSCKDLKHKSNILISFFLKKTDSGVLRITIHECKNLGSNKINPYAKLFINGKERFQTPTFKRTSNPKFEKPHESMVLDRTEFYIRVNIIDSINFAEDVSIGAWSGYLTDIMAKQDENEFWWHLNKNGQEIDAKIKLSVQWQPVVLEGLAKMGGIYTKPIGVIRFSIWSARNLPGSNRNDPYVRIKSGKQVRATTEVIFNTDVPEWGEFHYVPVHSLHENLVLEVMEYSSSSKDKSLGSTLLQTKDLVRECKKDKLVWYEAAVDKYDQKANLVSGNSEKGYLVYTAEFYPTMALAKKEQDQVVDPMPVVDLHHVPIRYTPDDLIDLASYSTGVLTVKIHEIKAPQVYECYCKLMVDTLRSQYKTNVLKGRVLPFNVTSDAFIKDAGFSRVAIEVKPADREETDDVKLAYWYDNSDRIIRNIQKRARAKHSNSESPFDPYTMLVHDDNDEGEWFDMINPVGGPAKIRLSFGYVPLLNYQVNPDESLESK